MSVGPIYKDRDYVLVTRRRGAAVHLHGPFTLKGALLEKEWGEQYDDQRREVYRLVRLAHSPPRGAA